MDKLVIIGAGGHGKVIADIGRKNGYEDIVFLDDSPDIIECGGYPVVGNSTKVRKDLGVYIVGVGNANVRKRIMDTLAARECSIVSLVHPSATVGENVSIGRGTVVMAGAVINPGAVIGQGCIINTCSSVDHDCILRDYVHVSVGAHLAGTVSVGEMTWIGIGAVVSNNLSVCSQCMIGAGAAVVKNIEETGTYIGVPARKIK